MTKKYKLFALLNTAILWAIKEFVVQWLLVQTWNNCFALVEISIDRAENKQLRGVARRILGYLWPPFVRQHDIYATKHSLRLLLTDILTDEQWD